MLENKLGAQLTEGDHHWYEIRHDGKYVARTKVSHGESEISSGIISAIARQIHVNTGQLTRLVDCTMSCDQYIDHLKSIGRL